MASSPSSSSKGYWRALLRARRAQVPQDVHQQEAEILARLAVDLAGGGAIVCAYVPFGSEPGSLDLLDALRKAGKQVLVPVATAASPLDWSWYHREASLVPGSYGLREPGGDKLGPNAIAAADLVLVPALGVDRRGVRLGKGGGHYDRSLPLARTGVPLVAIVRDNELVDELPVEPHDVRVTAALTPRGGLIELG